MSLDMLSVIDGFASFSIFLILLGFMLRFIHAGQILTTIKRIFLIAFVINIMLVACSSLVLERDLPWGDYVIVGCVSLMIYGLLSFVFILCLFGPNETSIRMRLIALIGKHADGLRREDIASQYNASTMLQVRLKRLVGAGDVSCIDNQYKLLNQGNAFFIIDQLAALLKKLYGMKD